MPMQQVILQSFERRKNTCWNVSEELTLALCFHGVGFTCFWDIQSWCLNAFTKMKTTPRPPWIDRVLWPPFWGCLSCKMCTRSGCCLRVSPQKSPSCWQCIGDEHTAGTSPQLLHYFKSEQYVSWSVKRRILDSLFQPESLLFSFLGPGEDKRVLILCSLCKALYLEGKKSASQLFSGTRKSVSDGPDTGWHLVLSDVFDDLVLWKGHEF